MLESLFSLLIFPGFLFLMFAGFLVEFVDRKLYARFQNRQGPPWYQPAADFIKLSSKEEIIPENASPTMFKLMPIVAIAAVVTPFFCIPLHNSTALMSFRGDLIVIMYLLTIPTVTFFLGGWHSTSLFATIGSVRALTQLFAYEVPLFLALLAPAILAKTWSVSEIAQFFNSSPWYFPLFNIGAFMVAIIAIQGKLERVPFDIPEAETEIVGGAFTEYNGRLLALFRMAIDIEFVVVASLLAAIFLPWTPKNMPFLAFGVYILKVFAIICVSALIRSVMARIRIEQMVAICWKYVAPIALVQILVNIILSGVALK
ncbi:MAG: NADH-quinone oxidoreductase subunit H [SAR324 cluster bacterium]|uniref:NADH-quinone oxidoreductase subunit H n=1 Tax=SAR324 cluster bacterium TaxID=2024889 RepID=A0A7X9IKI7_9DELT|nr:NADH-quinone oxidoreductase subunit H [SAR324 cluster bacterium]